MKITVKDCLELEVFRPHIMAAGKRNANNIVRSVSVMDAVDIKSVVKNNGFREQMVLTSFAGMREDGAFQEKVIKELAGAGVSALVVFEPDRIPNKLLIKDIEISEAVGLPFISFPKDNKSKYYDVIDQVMGKILVGDDSKNNLINNVVSHLLDFDRYKTFQAALKEAALTNEFQAVLVSRDFNPVLVVESRHHVTVADAVRKLQKNEDFDVRGRYSSLDVEGIDGYWGTVEIGDEDYFLLLVDNEEQYSALEITKLAEIIELAIGMWKYTPVRDVKAEFIKALMRSNRSLAHTLKDELDVDITKIISVFTAKGLDNQESVDIIAKFENRTGYQVVRINEGDESHGMVIEGVKDKSKDEQCDEKKRVCISLYDSLKETSNDIRIFHVTGMDGIDAAAEGFRLINETWTFVESVFPFKRVFSKYELVLVSNCINIQVRGGHIKKNYDELLEPFDKDMANNKGKQLMETLETFVLDAGLNSNKTSKIMGIHANTVQYRLKRINDILGVDITGNRVIPGLTISLALKRLERVIDA